MERGLSAADKISANEDHKSQLELSRYKQDCRKRALEAGWEMAVRLESTEIPTPDVVSKYADQFYKWLTEIPT